MKVAIYIADFSDKNIHLMPWRTVFEVLDALHSDGHEVLLLSGINAKLEIGQTKYYGDVPVTTVCKPFSDASKIQFVNFLRMSGVELLFFPISFVRNYSTLIWLEKQAELRLVWYVPGGWFSPWQIIKSIYFIGFKRALPYLVQALMPKRYFVKRLNSRGVRPVVVMSEFTGKMLKLYGYEHNRVFYAPPGKADLKKTIQPSNSSLKVLEEMDGEKYFLFFGPPNPIRGIFQIIDAFIELSQSFKDVSLICLFRGDKNIDPSSVRRRIEYAAVDNKIICFWESVSDEDLDLFLKNCYAVLKPFLIVPSEIPLAVLETAGYGKPVIGTGPDGTGAFIEKFGLTVPHANSKALTKAMITLIEDPVLYEGKRRAANAVYQAHPDWKEVAQIWLKAGKVDIG